QRRPTAGGEPGRHQECAVALRGGPGQLRGLHLDEVATGQQLPGSPVHPAAEPDGLGRTGATQVQVAVLQPRLLTDGDPLVDLERQWCGRVEYLELTDGGFDLAGRQVRGGHALWTTLPRTEEG